VRTILANPGDEFELVVVDQSTDGASTEALREFSGDARLRHHPTKSRGLSRARNEALALSRAEVLSFTDDDCRVPATFAADVIGFFRKRPDASLVFGRVIAPPELWEKGYVATFEPQERTFAGAFPPAMTPWGIGANMALRVRPALDVGGFDPCLGPGALVDVGGDELDFTMRALGAGLSLVHTAAFEVTHLGVREHAVSRALLRGYATGAGAAYMKNIRLRTPGVTKAFSSWVLVQGAAVVTGALRGRRPLGLGMMIATLRGTMQVLSVPLDREKRSFVAE
jgi:hypothetical protein